MLLDERTEFADAASVALAAGTHNVGDVIDLGAAARDLGVHRPLYLVITVDTSIITGGIAGTIAFQLVSDSTDTPATNGTQSIHYRSGTFVTDDDALNDLDAGDVAVCVALPMEGVVYERYLGVQAVVATETVTAGKINAFLTPDPAKWRAVVAETGL